MSGWVDAIIHSWPTGALELGERLARDYTSLAQAWVELDDEAALIWLVARLAQDRSTHAAAVAHSLACVRELLAPLLDEGPRAPSVVAALAGWPSHDAALLSQARQAAAVRASQAQAELALADGAARLEIAYRPHPQPQLVLRSLPPALVGACEADPEQDPMAVVTQVRLRQLPRLLGEALHYAQGARAGLAELGGARVRLAGLAEGLRAAFELDGRRVRQTGPSS